MKKYIIVYFLIICTLFTSCKHKSTYKYPFKNLSNQTTKEEIVKIFGEPNEEIIGYVYNNIKINEYYGKTRFLFSDDKLTGLGWYCTVTKDTYKEYQSNIIKAVKQTLGEPNYEIDGDHNDKYTWVKNNPHAIYELYYLNDKIYFEIKYN